MNKFKKGQIWLRTYSEEELATDAMSPDYFVLFYVNDVSHNNEIEAIQLTTIEEGSLRVFKFKADFNFAKSQKCLLLSE